jgi:hypothetical protein
MTTLCWCSFGSILADVGSILADVGSVWPSVGSIFLLAFVG